MLDPKVEQRILAAMNHEEGDRVPIWDYIDSRVIMDYFCPGWEDYRTAMVKVYHGLGIDLCRGYGSSFTEADTGATHKIGEADAVVSGQTCWVTHYPINILDDLKAYKCEPVDDDYIRNWIGFLREEKEAFEPHTMYIPCAGCGFHATYGLMGQELFSYAIYDDPASIERILEVRTENSYRMAKAAADASIAPIYFIGDDVAYKGATLFSPDYLRKTFVKSLKKCIEPVKAAGLKVIFHSDGYLMEIIDDLIDAGIDGLNPIEPLAGMDIGYIKKRYGKNLVLVGNVDCSHVLPRGTVEQVIEATRECLRNAGQGGGLLIGSSSEIVPSVPVENILAFYDACRTWGQYPLSNDL